MSQTISHIPSEVCLYGVQSGASCGYCKCDTSSISYGMVSSKLCVCDYEGLMLRGFRRSGTYFYKPVMHEVNFEISIYPCKCLLDLLSTISNTLERRKLYAIQITEEIDKKIWY